MESARLARIKAREGEVRLPEGEFGFIPLLEAVYRFRKEHPEQFQLSDLEEKALGEAQLKAHGVSRKKQQKNLAVTDTLALIDRMGGRL